jgi:hypothetical protein
MHMVEARHVDFFNKHNPQQANRLLDDQTTHRDRLVIHASRAEFLPPTEAHAIYGLKLLLVLELSMGPFVDTLHMKKEDSSNLVLRERERERIKFRIQSDN